jgi:hypothetical protein
MTTRRVGTTVANRIVEGNNVKIPYILIIFKGCLLSEVGGFLDFLVEQNLATLKI